MVKGISRQVIVVHSPDQKLFDQAIFLLKDNALGENGVTDELLLQEANRLIRSAGTGKKQKRFPQGPVWAFGGAAMTGLLWLLSVLV